MKKTNGRSDRSTWVPWVAAGSIVGVALPLAVVAPALGVSVMTLIAAVAIVLVNRRLRTLADAQEKISNEMDVLVRQLLKVEALASSAARARIESQPSSLVPAPETEALAAGIQDVTAEIGLLSGIVRELASVVAGQDRDIQRVKRLTSPVPLPASLEAPEAARQNDRELSPLPILRTVVSPTSTSSIVAEPIRESLSDPAREAALVAAFDDKGLEVWLQPIVTLPQRKVVSYEALARLRLGEEVLAPETFLPVLEQHGRSTTLDRRMLKSVVTIARHLQQRGSPAAIGYALSPLSVFELSFLRSLKSFVSDDTNLSGRLSIALPQASWRGLDAEQKTLLAELRGRVLLTLDRPSDLRFDTGLLTECGVVQIKVPASLLQTALRQNLSDIALEDLVTVVGRAGIRLVVTDVERETEVPDLIDLDVPLAQGTVFAPPRAVRTDVFAAAPSAVPNAQVAPGRPIAPERPPTRRPFRDFLRRAV